MQGKERNNREIDDQFVSQAWDSMKHLLDQEMPVTANLVLEERSGKRRLPLMLLMLLLSFGAGAAWMYWYYQNADPQPPEKEAPRAMLFESTTNDPIHIAKIKTSESENKSTLNTANKSDIATIVEESKSIIPITTISQAVAINTATPKPSIQFGWGDPSGISIETQKAFNSKQNKKNTPFIKVEEVRKGTAELALTKYSLTQENLSSSLTNSNPISSEPIATLATLSPIEPFKEIDTEISPSFFEPVQKKWHLALELASIRDNGTKEFSSSFSIGTLIERQLDNRFSLQSGIAWHHLNKRSNASKNVVNSFGLNTDTLESFILEDYYGNAVESGILEVLDYIKVPLQMNYKVNERIRIHTGVHLAYLMSPIRLGPKEDPPPVPEGEKPSAEVLDETRRTFVRKGLKKMDFGVQIGMGFYPTKKIGVFVNYNSGLLDFSDNVHFQFREVHSNQYLQLGLIYYPFKKR